MKEPLIKSVLDSRYSECASDLTQLDWQNWFSDYGLMASIYIHVRHLDCYGGHTWHRVYPRTPKGRVCHRISVRSGVPCWVFDKEGRVV